MATTFILKLSALYADSWQMPKEFTVSILTYKRADLAERCIKSVMASRCWPRVSLILTDNGDAGRAGVLFEGLASLHPNIRVVHNATNLGFIEPNKMALSMCETPYFVMLNDDTEVTDGWLDALKEPFTKNEKAAISGVDGGCCFLQPTFHGSYGPKEYVEFSCAMLKASIFKEHGLFDKNLVGAYSEDSNCSLRARELGYTLHWVPMALKHVRGATSRQVKEVNLWQEMNHAYSRRRWRHYLATRRMDYPILIKRNAALGDVLLATPIIREIKKQRPLSKIYVDTACPDVLAGNPYVSRAGQGVDRGNSLVIDLNMAYESRKNINILDAYIEIAKDVTCIDTFTRDLDFFVNQTDVAKAEPYKGFVAVHIGPTTWPSKNWPIDRWQAVIDELNAMGHKVVLVGHGDASPINNATNLRGSTSLSMLGAVLANCALLITVDSFPLHLAQAMKTPVVGLFGITDPRYILSSTKDTVAVCGNTPTFGLRHRKTDVTSVTDGGSAMLSITTESVINAIKTQLHVRQLQEANT